MTIVAQNKKPASTSSASPSAMPQKSFVAKEIYFLREKAEEVKPGLFLLYSTHS